MEDIFNLIVAVIAAFILGMAVHSTWAHYLPNGNGNNDENTEKEDHAKKYPKLTHF